MTVVSMWGIRCRVSGARGKRMDEMTSADHAFTAFLAGVGPERMYDEELRMFRWFQKHPAQSEYRAIEAAIAAYEQGKRK